MSSIDGFFVSPTQNPKTLTDEDYSKFASAFSINEAMVRAVLEVESSGRGFTPDGKTVLRWEPGVFNTFTNGRYRTTHPILYERVGVSGSAAYFRLQTAVAVDEEAALKSCSLGLPQIMGFNYVSAGFRDLPTFYMTMARSEKDQVNAFFTFLCRTKINDKEFLISALRGERWAEFAYHYNGAGYKANNYDVALEAAYEKWSKRLSEATPSMVNGSVSTQGGINSNPNEVAIIEDNRSFLTRLFNLIRSFF